MTRTKLNLWPFYHLTFTCDLDPNGITTPQGVHLRKIILKSMHKCRSYGSDKLIYVTFMCDLDLQSTLKMFQMARPLLKDNCVK